MFTVFLNPLFALRFFQIPIMSAYADLKERKMLRRRQDFAELNVIVCRSSFSEYSSSN